MRRLSLLMCAVAMGLALAVASQDKGIVTTGSGSIAPVGEGRYRKVHLLVIGINNYDDPKINDLSYAVNDAVEFTKLMVERYGILPENVTALIQPLPGEDPDLRKKLFGGTAVNVAKLPTAQRPTLESMRRAFQRLTDKEVVGPNDAVIVFVSAHGARTEGDGVAAGWLVPQDARHSLGESNIALLARHSIPMKEIANLLSLSPSRHLAIFGDMCFAGSLVKSKNGFENSEFSALNHARKGQFVFAATEHTATAKEESKWGHGRFTYFLLQELKARSGLSSSFLVNDLVNPVKVAAATRGQVPVAGLLPDSQEAYLVLTPRRVSVVKSPGKPNVPGTGERTPVSNTTMTGGKYTLSPPPRVYIDQKPVHAYSREEGKGFAIVPFVDGKDYVFSVHYPLGGPLGAEFLHRGKGSCEALWNVQRALNGMRDAEKMLNANRKDSLDLVEIGFVTGPVIIPPLGVGRATVSVNGKEVVVPKPGIDDQESLYRLQKEFEVEIGFFIKDLTTCTAMTTDAMKNIMKRSSWKAKQPFQDEVLRISREIRKHFASVFSATAIVHRIGSQPLAKAKQDAQQAEKQLAAIGVDVMSTKVDVADLQDRLKKNPGLP